MKKHLLLSVGLLAAGGLVAPPPGAFAQAQANGPVGVQSAPAQPSGPARNEAKPAEHGSATMQNAEGPTDQAAQAPAHGQDQGAPDDQDQGGAQDQQAQQQAFPVQMITSIEVMRSAGQPVRDIVRVRGLTAADGWSDPQLVVVGPANPADGILDLVLVAVPPSDRVEADGAAPIEAIMPLASGEPYKGVRVHAAGNAVTVQQMPGLVEAKAPPQLTGGYAGKRLLAKGEAMPAGATASEMVRSEDLPADLRVIRPDSGISDITPDPNRLTLMVGADGRITEAFWN